MPDDKKLPNPAELSQQTLLTTPECAAYLRCTPNAIRSRVTRGEIPKSAIVQRSRNGRMLFKRSEIDRLYGITTSKGVRK